MSELSRYKMRCRRGMKELDFVLDRYLEQHFPHADADEKQLFDSLLDTQDPQLFGWIFELESVPEAYQAITAKIRQAV